MAGLSPEAQAILDGFDNSSTSTSSTLSPAAQEIINQYSRTAAPAADSEAYKSVTPEEQALIRNYKPAIGTTLGNVGMNALIAMRNGYEHTPYPFKPLGGPFAGVMSLVNSAGEAVSPYLSKIPGIENVLTPAALGRDLAGSPDAYAGSPNALITPRQFVPSIPNVKGPVVPLAQNEAPMVGSGYLKGEGVQPVTGRTFDVAADGSVKLAEAPTAVEPVNTPSTPVEPAAQAPGVKALPAPEIAPAAPSESTVGAAQTPASEATPEMSRGEARARQAMDEGGQLLQSDSDRRVGLIDTNQYVPGIIRTLGRMDLAHAAEESALRDKFPTEFKNLVDTPNNNTLVQYITDATPTDLEKFNLESARDARAATDIAPMKSNPKPVDVSPVVKMIEDQQEEGAADRGFINSALENVKKTLIKGTDDEGNPILRDDPNRLYEGARKNITDMLERAKADPASNEATAYSHLMDIKQSLDAAITKTNPAFRTYLDNYAAASKPIDEATVMGGIRKQLTDMNGNMTLGRVHKVLSALDTARNDKAGANPSQHVTFDTMQKLFDVRNELQAQAARDAFVKANGGSNTHLRLLNGQKYTAPPPSPVRNLLTNLGEIGAHGISGMVDPTTFAGNALIRFGAENLRNRTEAMNAAKAQAMNDAHEAALRSRLQNFISPPMDSEGNPMIGHNGGPPLDDGTQPTGFNQPPGPRSGGAAASTPEEIASYRPTTVMAASYESNPLASDAQSATVQPMVTDSYKGQHEAPGASDGSPLHDVTKNGTYPTDVYGSKGYQYYGDPTSAADRESFNIVSALKGKPNADVKMYRAVPKDSNLKGINPGDWVSISRKYAVEHGQANLNNDFKIVSKTVKARDLHTNGDSMSEWGYDPQPRVISARETERLRRKAEATPSFDWSPGGTFKTATVGSSTIDYGISSDGKTGEVISLKTPPSERNQGSARNAMTQLLNEADSRGTTMFLNSDPMDKGVSKTGLDKFYRSLGFVKNTGRNKDFSSTAEFVRQPQKNPLASRDQ